MLIRESHMLEERGGEEKKWETDGLSEKGTMQCLWKTSFIVEICLQLFAGFSPHYCRIIFSSSLFFFFFIIIICLFLSQG